MAAVPSLAEPHIVQRWQYLRPYIPSNPRKHLLRRSYPVGPALSMEVHDDSALRRRRRRYGGLEYSRLPAASGVNQTTSPRALRRFYARRGHREKRIREAPDAYIESSDSDETAGQDSFDDDSDNSQGEASGRRYLLSCVGKRDGMDARQAALATQYENYWQNVEITESLQRSFAGLAGELSHTRKLVLGLTPLGIVQGPVSHARRELEDVDLSMESSPTESVNPAFAEHTSSTSDEGAYSQAGTPSSESARDINAVAYAVSVLENTYQAPLAVSSGEGGPVSAVESRSVLHTGLPSTCSLHRTTMTHDNLSVSRTTSTSPFARI